MSLKLKFLTCPQCGGHTYHSYSYNGETVKVDCRCGHEYKTEFQFKTVDYPNVTILGETFKKLNVEKEIFYNETENDAPFGVNIKLEFHKESHYSGRGKTRYNATEFHYLYDHIENEPRIAIESNIHYSGGTIDLPHIKSIVITKATKKHRSH
jgi:hypothetical protein